MFCFSPAPICLLATAAECRQNSSTRTQAIRRPRHLWHTHGPNFTPCFSDPNRCSTIPTFTIADCVPLLVTQYRLDPGFYAFQHDLILDKISQQNICIPLLTTLAFSKPSACMNRLKQASWKHKHTQIFAVTIHRPQT